MYELVDPSLQTPVGAMTSPLVSAEYPRLGLPQILVFNLLIIVWWLEVGLRIPALGEIRLEFLLAVAATLMAIVRRLRGSNRRERLHRKIEGNGDVASCMAMLLVVLAIGVPFAIDTRIAWDAFFNRVVKLALIGALISHFVVSPATLRIYLLSQLVAFMKIGQEALFGKITGSMVWENQGVPRLHGTAGSMFGHPNSLSGKTVSSIPWVVYLYPVVQRRWAKILLVVQFVFAINIVIFTASRTGYLTVIVIATLMVLMARRNRLRWILVLLVSVATTASFMPPEYKQRFMSSFTGQEAEGQSSATRKALLVDSLNTFVENPLGVGIGGFRQYQAMHGRNAQDTHNLYTQILAEAGIQGFICFVMLVFVILRKAFRCRRGFTSIVDGLSHTPLGGNESKDASAVEQRNAQLLLATTNALIVFVIARLVLGLFGHDFLEIYWWLAAGLVMALHKMRLVAERRCEELLARRG